MLVTVDKGATFSNVKLLLEDISNLENVKSNIDMFEKILDEKFLVKT